MLVIVVVGIMSAIAIPTYIKRLHRQRLDAGANQILTHLRQAKSRALKNHEYYRLNFKNFENAYVMETAATNANNDDAWESLQIMTHDKDEELIGDDTDINPDHIIYLPKDIRILDNGTTDKIIFNPKGYVEPYYSLPAEVTLTSIADGRKRLITVNLAGVPNVSK
jgi:Tfp pilus assembly protein FimT